MTDYEDKFMEQIEQKWAKANKRDFIDRMNRKLNRKERYSH